MVRCGRPRDLRLSRADGGPQVLPPARVTVPPWPPASSNRALIRARTGEGRKRAKDRGVRFGRPPALTPHQRQEALARREAGETLMDIARSYGVSHPTISRL